MTYIDKNLIRGERVLYEGSISLWSLARWIVIGMVGLMFFFMDSKLGLIPFFAGTLCLAGALIKFASTELAVTSLRVIAKYGWLARQTVEISLGKVEGIEVRQTLVQRVLGFGNVFVSGTGSHKARIANVSDPIAFRRAFLSALETYDRQDRGPQDRRPVRDTGS